MAQEARNADESAAEEREEAEEEVSKISKGMPSDCFITLQDQQETSRIKYADAVFLL